MCMNSPSLLNDLLVLPGLRQWASPSMSSADFLQWFKALWTVVDTRGHSLSEHCWVEDLSVKGRLPLIPGLSRYRHICKWTNSGNPSPFSPPTSLEYFLLRHVLPGYFESLENIEGCLLTSLRRRALASGSLYPPQVLLCFCQCISQEARGCSPFWHERRLVCLWVSLLMSGGGDT